MIRKSLIYLFFFIFTNVAVNAQELRCNVQIISQQIQGTNKQVFETLQRAVYEFMNNTSWTGLSFGQIEQIECNMMFNLQEQIGNDEFRGMLQIQVRRPVFNTSYNTVLLNMVDNDLHFRYEEFQPLEFNENSHQLNLTSILAYYAYLIIGMDFDSFSPEGGTPYFQKAEKIVNNAQNAREKGWKASESTTRKNRYWLINQIVDEEFSNVREFTYKYHRLGLDRMQEETNKARADMVEYMELLKEVYREKPDPYMYFFQVVVEAKSDEWVSVFKPAIESEKSRVIEIFNEIDPSHRSKYEAIIKN
ncbi:MAG: DUF4835 family protein [Bacteroidales bacterium]|nr:DUF4835 family protein [Bacteroidales bacterium]